MNSCLGIDSLSNLVERYVRSYFSLNALLSTISRRLVNRNPYHSSYLKARTRLFHCYLYDRPCQRLIPVVDSRRDELVVHSVSHSVYNTQFTSDFPSSFMRPLYSSMATRLTLDLHGQIHRIDHATSVGSTTAGHMLSGIHSKRTYGSRRVPRVLQEEDFVELDDVAHGQELRVSRADLEQARSVPLEIYVEETTTFQE